MYLRLYVVVVACVSGMGASTGAVSDLDWSLSLPLRCKFASCQLCGCNSEFDHRDYREHDCDGDDYDRPFQQPEQLCDKRSEAALDGNENLGCCYVKFPSKRCLSRSNHKTANTAASQPVQLEILPPAPTLFTCSCPVPATPSILT